MTEIEEMPTTGIYSKFGKISLVVISMLLIFAGPTYVPYLLRNHVGDFANAGIGAVLFIVGIGLMFFLARKKIITV
jgi:hypothetical protein